MDCILARVLIGSSPARHDVGFREMGGPRLGAGTEPTTPLFPSDNPQRKGPHLGCDTLNPRGDLVTKDPGTSSGLGASAPPGWWWWWWELCLLWVPVQTCSSNTTVHATMERNNSHIRSTQAGTQARQGAEREGMKTRQRPSRLQRSQFKQKQPAASGGALKLPTATHITHHGAGMDGGPVYILP